VGLKAGNDQGVDVKRIKNRTVVMLSLISLFAMAAAVSAAEGEEKEDTVFNFGTDPVSKVFVWGTSSTDGELDCSLEGQQATASFVLDDDGLVMVDQLYDESMEPVEFPTREEGGDAVAYSADGECALAGGVVSGPNGQINHGMFMKLFNSLWEGNGRGCLMRHLAQSELGKGDQQVKVGDVDPDAEPLMDGDTGTIDFASVLADCEHGNGNGNGNGNGDLNGNGNGHGRPDSPGNSGSAPGQNP
jgi:hypothetical protein